METPRLRPRKRWSDWLNPLVTRKPKRFFEICDLHFTPGVVCSKCQALLTAEWTHKLPLIQKASPAEMAATLIENAIERLTNDDDSKLSVVDFCSGAGGPVPTIERLVNSKRLEKNQKPVPFLLTDIKPHISSWMAASSKSDHLSFIPQSVDATNPPTAVTSTSATATATATATDPSDFFSSTRIFRLYSLAFHHFPDPLARSVLASTLATADGFAILELQDRRLASLLLMLLVPWLVFAASLFWFWYDPLHLLLTYVLPVLPLLVAFDGAVSALRTREFSEVVALIDDVLTAGDGGEGECVREEDGGSGMVVRRGEWVFEGGRELHTWPIGYMNWVVGYKKPA